MQSLINSEIKPFKAMMFHDGKFSEVKIGRASCRERV